MSIPSTQKQWVISAGGKDFEGLQQKEGEVPKLGDNDVLVKLHAASLNYRDLAIAKGMYPFPLNLPKVASSDGAGEVVAVGPRVTQFKKGDKVCTLFNQGHQYGELTPSSVKTALGGMLEGTLRGYGAFPETGLVRAPENLDHVEASTLPCAALTSWNALYGLKPLKPGEWVVVQGTGGVSLFALQFAKAAGAKVIATTSSAAKAEKLRKLGADHVINYRETAEWGVEAKKLTPNGVGADHIIEVGGEHTMGQSLKAVRYGGIITIIGFLGGAQPKENCLEALSNICTLRGVFVGSREQMEDMVRAIETNDIHPVVDERVFPFEQAREAYEYMWAQKHFGKLCISIQ